MWKGQGVSLLRVNIVNVSLFLYTSVFTVHTTKQKQQIHIHHFENAVKVPVGIDKILKCQKNKMLSDISGLMWM